MAAPARLAAAHSNLPPSPDSTRLTFTWETTSPRSVTYCPTENLDRQIKFTHKKERLNIILQIITRLFFKYLTKFIVKRDYVYFSFKKVVGFFSNIGSNYIAID